MVKFHKVHQYLFLVEEDIMPQLPVNCWHEVIGEKTVADAILDRIAHDAHRVELKGESLRKNREKQRDMDILN